MDALRRALKKSERREQLRAAALVLPLFLFLLACMLFSRLNISDHHLIALVPIAAGMGKPGSEIQAPMAMVILLGLLTSTALNMVVVPAAYYRFRR